MSFRVGSLNLVSVSCRIANRMGKLAFDLLLRPLPRPYLHSLLAKAAVAARGGSDNNIFLGMGLEMSVVLLYTRKLLAKKAKNALECKITFSTLQAKC